MSWAIWITGPPGSGKSVLARKGDCPPRPGLCGQAEAGVPVIIDATAPRRRWRELARELITPYAEVQLICPPEVCGTRERAGRWTPASWVCAARPSVTRGPDIVLDYEASLNPDLVVHTNLTVWSATDEIVTRAHRLQRRIGEPPCASAIS